MKHHVSGRLMLDMALSYSPTVLKRLALKNHRLLVRWSAINLLQLSLNFSNGNGSLNLEGVGRAVKSHYKYIHGYSLRPEGPSRKTNSLIGSPWILTSIVLELIQPLNLCSFPLTSSWRSALQTKLLFSL